MKLTNVPEKILTALRLSGRSDSAIEKLPPKELFTAYCDWLEVPKGGLLYDLAIQVNRAAMKDAMDNNSNS